MNVSRPATPQDSTTQVGDARRPLPPLSERELAETCRDLEARGIKYAVVGGVPVVPQGFARAVKGENLFEQCLEMNRQAVVRSETPPSSTPA